MLYVYKCIKSILDLFYNKLHGHYRWLVKYKCLEKDFRVFNSNIYQISEAKYTDLGQKNNYQFE